MAAASTTTTSTGRAQQHGDERDAEAGGAGVEHQVASVGEGLGDDEGGQQRRRQQRDDAEQRAGGASGRR